MFDSFFSSEPPISFGESKTARAVSHSTAAHPCGIGQEDGSQHKRLDKTQGNIVSPVCKDLVLQTNHAVHPPFMDLISSLLYQTFPENPVPAENLSQKSRFISNSFFR